MKTAILLATLLLCFFGSAHAAELKLCNGAWGDTPTNMPCVSVGCTGAVIQTKENTGQVPVPALDHEWKRGEPGGKCGLYINCPAEVGRIASAWFDANGDKICRGK
jgi:hypothetical protein